MPRTAIPFVPQMYDPTPGTIRMSELARRRAQDQADLRLREGDISATMAQQLAGIGASVAQTIGQYKAEEPERKAKQAEQQRLSAIDQALRQSMDPETGRIDFSTAGKLVAPIDPMTSLQFFEKADSAQKQAVIKAAEMSGEAAQKAGSLLLRYQQLSPPAAQAEYDSLRQWATSSGIPDADQMPEQFSAPFLRKVLFGVMTADQIRQQVMGAEKPPEGFTLSEGQTRFGADGKPIANVPKPTPQPEPFTLSPGSQRFGPDGKVIASVPAPPREPKDQSYQRIETVDEAGNPIIKFMTAEEIRAMGGVPTSPKTTAKASGPATVDAILGEIEGLSQQINTSGGGPMSNLTGAVRRGAAAANLDNTVSEYQALVNGFIPMVARAVGHTGVLTQQDVDSVRALFPQTGDNAELAAAKLQRVRRIMAAMQPEGAPTRTATPAPATPAAPAAPRVNPFKRGGK